MSSVADWLLHLVPDTFFSAFSTGESLQVLLLALLTGFAMAAVERGGVPISEGLDRVGAGLLRHREDRGARGA